MVEKGRKGSDGKTKPPFAGAILKKHRFYWENGAPWVIRTPDLLVRSQTLYPAELRAQRGKQLIQKL
jgi:hypothetical protein